MKNKILFAIFAALLLLVTAYAASAQVPIITSTPPTSVVVEHQYRYQMTTNGTNVTFGIVNGPAGSAIDLANGLFIWTPFNTTPATVTLIATENAGTTYSNSHMQQFTITVLNASSAPSTQKMLEITDVEYKVNGKKTSDLDEVELNDEITVIVTVANNFAVDNSDTEMDVELKVSSRDIDEADDYEDQINNLEADDEEDFTFSFTLDPESIDPSDSPFSITLDVTGEVRNNTKYSDSETITIDMDVNSKDLFIYNVEVTPLSFTNCAENRVKISMDLKNIGSKDLDNAAVRMRISDLGISKFPANLAIDSGDDDSISDYLVIPKGTAPGTYIVDVQAFPQRTSSTVTSETATSINVLACSTGSNSGNTSGTGSTGSGNTGSGSGSNGGTIIIPDVSISGTPVSTSVGKKGIFDSNNAIYVVLLVVLALLLITVASLLVLKIREA